MPNIHNRSAVRQTWLLKVSQNETSGCASMFEISNQPTSESV